MRGSMFTNKEMTDLSLLYDFPGESIACITLDRFLKSRNRHKVCWRLFLVAGPPQPFVHTFQ